MNDHYADFLKIWKEIFEYELNLSLEINQKFKKLYGIPSINDVERISNEIANSTGNALNWVQRVAYYVYNTNYKN